jgi:alkylhydroperoxidase/carboxymuconolactone decarboxylase family protein YurZ
MWRATSVVMLSAGKDERAVDHIETLRRLAISDERILDKLVCAAPDDGDTPEPDGALDPRTLALVRLAALAAVGGAVPSYGAQADAAVDAGASAAEMVDVLIAVLPVVGIPCVVAAAPKLALALGYDSDDALEQLR